MCIRDSSSIVLLFQPMSTKAGAGIIIDNKLINGKHNVAGEMKYLPVNLLEKGANVYKTPEDIIKIVKYISLSIISVIGPEAIVIFCSLLPNIEDLENELKTVLPQAVSYTHLYIYIQISKQSNNQSFM